MEQAITLDVRKRAGKFSRPVELDLLRRGEKGNVPLTVCITKDGAPYDLTGKEVYLRSKTSQGRVVFDDIESGIAVVNAKGGVVSHTLPPGFASEPGAMIGYYEIRQGDFFIDTTESFTASVVHDIDLSAESAADYIPKFDRITAEAQAATAAANDAAKSASETNESVKSAEAARADAESVRTQNETWRIEAENARAGSENDRASAEAARSTAEADRVRAEKSRVNAETAREITIRDFVADVAAGAFDGAAAGFGDIEVTVDDGVGVPGVVVTESGPDTAKSLRLDFKNLKGERGSDGNGITTSLDPGFFTMSVESDGHLYVTHNDNEPAPPLSIRDGKLIYTIN